MADPSKPAIDAVLRIPDVTVSRTSLEIAVGHLDRFEASAANGTSYAQIDAPKECIWADVLALMERVGPVLLSYFGRGEIGRPSLDVGLSIEGDRTSVSLLVPNDVVVAAGRFGFDLEASAYLATA
jgi:hypothetical protein